MLIEYEVLTAVTLKSRGEQVNGGHLRELQDKTKNIRKVENVYKLAFCTNIIPFNVQDIQLNNNSLGSDN
jgi:hypothetical protein